MSAPWASSPSLMGVVALSLVATAAGDPTPPAPVDPPDGCSAGDYLDYRRWDFVDGFVDQSMMQAFQQLWADWGSVGEMSWVRQISNAAAAWSVATSMVEERCSTLQSCEWYTSAIPELVLATELDTKIPTAFAESPLAASDACALPKRYKFDLAEVMKVIYKKAADIIATDPDCIDPDPYYVFPWDQMQLYYSVFLCEMVQYAGKVLLEDAQCADNGRHEDFKTFDKKFCSDDLLQASPHLPQGALHSHFHSLHSPLRTLT